MTTKAFKIHQPNEVNSVAIFYSLNIELLTNYENQ